MQAESHEALIAFLATTCALVAIIAGMGRQRAPGTLPAPSTEVIDLLWQGRTIQATRAYRRQVPVTLAEAWGVITATIRKLEGLD